MAMLTSASAAARTARLKQSAIGDVMLSGPRISPALRGERIELVATARLASAGCKDMARQIDGRLRALASLRGLGVCHAASAVYSSPASWRWQLVACSSFYPPSTLILARFEHRS